MVHETVFTGPSFEHLGMVTCKGIWKGDILYMDLRVISSHVFCQRCTKVSKNLVATLEFYTPEG